MKKVSFIKGESYSSQELGFLPEDELEIHFTPSLIWQFTWLCTESFTAEITVKIVPYEQV